VVAGRPAAADDLALLRGQFARWAANDARFTRLAEGNALLEEARPLSAGLAALGAAGLRALELLQAGDTPPAAWLAAETARLGRWRKPAAEVLLAAYRPVEVLIAELARRPKR
jgi:hypothetical protein